MLSDQSTWIFVVGVLVLLGGATAVGQFLKGQPESSLNPAILETFNRRVRAWWLLCSLLAAAVLLPPGVTVALFGLLAFWALREFITLTPTRLSDHRTLFWVFMVFTPAQFILVGLDKYDLYSILIPVYGVLFIAARVAFSGDPKRFLERTAKIQAGLVICVYCISFAPALLYLDIYRTEQIVTVDTVQVDTVQVDTLQVDTLQVDPQQADTLQVDTLQADSVPDGTEEIVRETVGPGRQPWRKNRLLLFYFVFLVQMGDALQYVWGKLLGHRVIAPAISPTRTWEGFLGGVGSTALLGAVLWWATPFNEWQAGCMAAVVAVAGFAGGMTMSAIKRDRGVKDYGTLVAGHGGVLDRIDSLCFAAPIFFHLTRLFYTVGP